jgi:hypothetical protein
MDKEHVRFYIKVRTALNIPPIVIYNELHTVFGDQAPLLRTVQRWSKAFLEGREEVEDEERSGRPVTETTPENIDQVRDLIDDDPYLIVDEIEEQTGLSHGTVQRIISDHLQLRKIIARYVPKHLTNSQKAVPRSTSVHRNRSVPLNSDDFFTIGFRSGFRRINSDQFLSVSLISNEFLSKFSGIFPTKSGPESCS